MQKIISCTNENPKKVLTRYTVAAYRSGQKIRSEKLIAYNTKTNRMEVLYKLIYTPKIN